MFLYLKMRHRPWDVDSHKAWEPDDGFQRYNFFSFSFLIYMMPKICSQGYNFSCGCLQKRRAKRIYLLDPSHKDNELQNSWCPTGSAEGGHTQPSSGLHLKQSHVTGVRAIAPVCINSHCLVKKSGITVHQCHVSGLFWPAGTSCFLQYPALDICNDSNRAKQLLCLQ